MPNRIGIPSGEPLGMSPSSGGSQQLWRFSNDDVFGLTFDDFMEQLTDLQTVFEAAVSFQSLEKLEIGGYHGKFLTERLRQVKLNTFF